MTTGVYPENPTFECIASHIRRESLHALNGWESSVSTAQLVAHLSATTQGNTPPGDTATEILYTQLSHVHLPALAAANLVSWDRDRGVVRTTAHPALDDPRFEQLLEIEADELDAVLSALAHDYRRIALTELSANRTKSRSDLVRAIRRRFPDSVLSDVPSSETISRSLHHVHLPKLEELSLLEFEPSTGQVASVDHPVLEQVFAIIFDWDDSAVDRLDGFFDGLANSYRDVSRGTNGRVDWPHFWSEPHNG